MRSTWCSILLRAQSSTDPPDTVCRRRSGGHSASRSLSPSLCLCLTTATLVLATSWPCSTSSAHGAKGATWRLCTGPLRPSMRARIRRALPTVGPRLNESDFARCDWVRRDLEDTVFLKAADWPTQRAQDATLAGAHARLQGLSVATVPSAHTKEHPRKPFCRIYIHGTPPCWERFEYVG
jgi:hypothetical protein